MNDESETRGGTKEDGSQGRGQGAVASQEKVTGEGYGSAQPLDAAAPVPRRSRRWIFWLFFIVSSFTFVSALSVFLLVYSLDVAPVRVSSGSTLNFEFSGDYPESMLYDIGGPFIEVEQLTVREVVEGIRGAAADDRIESLLLRVRAPRLGWAKALEIRDALTSFKSSGKPLVAYVEQAGNLDYFVASAADIIYLHPQGLLDLRGLQAEVTFMKTALSKLGVEAEFEQIGAYKNSPDVFTRTSMSEAHREALESVIGDFYDHFVDSIAANRGQTREEFEELLHRGPFHARAAKEAGLVDGLQYLDEVEAGLSPDEDDYTPLPLGKYLRSTESTLLRAQRIAVIYGVGTILPGESVDDPMFGQVMGADTIAQAFRTAREDRSVGAVVFRIDSPGGSDIGSDIIWREAHLTMQEKPVVVSMSDVAASGGYWIATASHVIVAQPTTLTGSIGIYAGKWNLAGLYEKIGLHEDIVSRGGSADFWSDTRSFNEEERARFRRLIEDGYNRFLTRVAEGRNQDVDEVDAVAQGRIWTGVRALEIGLVDELGGLRRAVAIAAERANLPEDTPLKIFPQQKSYFDMLVSRLSAGAPRTIGLEALGPDRLLLHSPVGQFLLGTHRMALAPFHLEVR